MKLIAHRPGQSSSASSVVTTKRRHKYRWSDLLQGFATSVRISGGTNFVGGNMPKYSNRFQESAYYEHVIVDEDGSRVGTIRIKPVSVLWKPKNKQNFYKVKLERFDELMEAHGVVVSR